MTFVDETHAMNAYSNIVTERTHPNFNIMNSIRPCRTNDRAIPLMHYLSVRTKKLALLSLFRIEYLFLSNFVRFVLRYILQVRTYFSGERKKIYHTKLFSYTYMKKKTRFIKTVKKIQIFKLKETNFFFIWINKCMFVW